MISGGSRAIGFKRLPWEHSWGKLPREIELNTRELCLQLSSGLKTRGILPKPAKPRFRLNAFFPSEPSSNLTVRSFRSLRGDEERCRGDVLPCLQGRLKSCRSSGDTFRCPLRRTFHTAGRICCSTDFWLRHMRALSETPCSQSNVHAGEIARGFARLSDIRNSCYHLSLPRPETSSVAGRNHKGRSSAYAAQVRDLGPRPSGDCTFVR